MADSANSNNFDNDVDIVQLLNCQSELNKLQLNVKIDLYQNNITLDVKKLRNDFGIILAVNNFTSEITTFNLNEIPNLTDYTLHPSNLVTYPILMAIYEKICIATKNHNLIFSNAGKRRRIDKKYNH